MIHAIFILFIKLNILKNIQYSKNLNITDKLNNNKNNLLFFFILNTFLKKKLYTNGKIIVNFEGFLDLE